MIDRKTFWITLVLTAIMLAAAIWRISLLPDWTLFPIENGRTTRHSHFALFLFAFPLWLISYLGILTGKRWLRRGTPEEVQPWAKFYGATLIPGGALMIAMQFFIIARSLGIASTLDRMAVARFFVVATGIWMIVIGNGVPKLPWLASRLKIFELPPAQGAKLLRFRGWLTVGIGAVYVLGGLFLRARFLMLVMAATVVSALVIGLVRRVQLKRERHF